MSQISQLQKTIHAWAIRKGWRGPDADVRPPSIDLALFTSEISEALEELRKNGDPKHYYETYSVEVRGVEFKNMTREQLAVLLDVDTEAELDDMIEELNLSAKPEGFGPEVGDLMIRVLETCEENGIDLDFEIERKMAYNEGRPYRHGGLLL